VIFASLWCTALGSGGCVGKDCDTASSLPSWLPVAALGFLQGFTSQADLSACVMGAIAPISDLQTGIADIKKGVKERNLTDIEEGVASLLKLMQDVPSAMKSCKAEEADVIAIIKVLKGFHSLEDIINHIKADFAADDQGEIAAQFELMVRSFERKEYEDFGTHIGDLLHRILVGPKSLALSAGATSLPSWLPIAALGFLQGFTSQADLSACIMGVLAPVGDLQTGILDIKQGIKEPNVTKSNADIVEGVASLLKLRQDVPSAMRSCKAEEADVTAIIKVLKSFHSLEDIIDHMKADFAADDKGEIAAQFELMVRSFGKKEYEAFGEHFGDLLHRLIIGPKSKAMIVV